MNASKIRLWVGLAVLLLPTMLFTVDLGALWLATPSLAADLKPTSTELLWINDVYGFVIACTLVLMGNLGDRLGQRRLLLFGSAMFGVASLVAAFAPTPGVLIAGRAVLGVAGASIIPSTLALISNMFVEPRRRATAIAMWVTALSAGIAIGPVVSGLMLAKLWWGSVFLIAVPIMLLALIVVPITVPDYRNSSTQKLDRVSVPLLLLALFPLVFAIKRFGESGLDWGASLALAVAIVFGALFVLRQRRIDDPLLDLRLFANRTFATALVLLFIGLAAMNGVEYLVPQYFQLVSQLPSFQAGLLMVLPAVGLVIGSQLTLVLARHMRPAYVVALGAVLAIMGFALLTTLSADRSGIALAVTATTIMMMGLAPITVLGTSIAVGAAPPARTGQASSVGQTSYELGLAFGIAATGSVVAAIYRHDVQASAPSGVATNVVTETANNLSGGLGIAEHLPKPAGDALASVVRAAFTSGLHTAAIVSGGLTVLFLVLAVVLLRRVNPVRNVEQEQTNELVDSTAESAPVH